MIEEIIPITPGIPGNSVELRKKILTREIQKYNAEVLVITPSGDKKWIRDTSISLIDQRTGRVIGLTGIYFDISDQKQIHIQLEKTKERATESDRLKTAFLNNLSHEIRTPLNAIVGFATLLADPGNKQNERAEYMDIITHSSDHLLEIVDDIVEISKIETKIVKIKLKETNLNEMLRRVYDRFKPAALSKNILLKYEEKVGEEDIIVVTDGYKLFMTLTNLVSNAIKFTQEGKVEFGFRFKDDIIQFYVSDTGRGVEKEHQTNIFKPFYQVEMNSTARSEGTGLGLSIARAYVEMLGGQIWYTTEPGRGSVFSFCIPYRS
jgi:signal transduction histidine kinase